ncbi:hypothetical protein ACFW3D_06525 [Streptomyces sp. NPDC058864]
MVTHRTSPGEALVAAVTGLRDDVAGPHGPGPAPPGPRAHEILESTVQFELTGRTDFGGETLGTARANLDGTREADREPGPEQATLDAFTSDGGSAQLLRLSRAQREQVDAALDELVERLAPVATLCGPRGTA